MLNNPFSYPDEQEVVVPPANEPVDDLEQFAKVVSSIEAEQSVLGGLFLDSSAILDVVEILSESDFFRSEHRRIFSAIATLANAGDAVDVITVSDRIASLHGQECVNLPYMVELASNVAGTANVMAYARIVFEKSIKRQVLAAVTQVNRYVLDTPSATAEEVVNHAQTALVELNDRSDRSTRAVTASEALKDYVTDLDNRFRNGNKIQGFSSGFNNVDRTINGWKRGHLIIIAGRPGMGKTTYALQVVSNMALYLKLNGLIFSLEMPQNELTEKLIACHGQINLESLQNPADVRDEQFWPSVESAARRIKDAPLGIVECPAMHINQLKSYARKAHRRQKLDWLMIDHIHIMGSDGQNRERQISQITADLKNLAGELQIPIFALAQLNRKVEDRKFEDRAPRISDLRDSGGVEQDADIIQLIFRPDYYNDNPHKANEGLIQVETAKHRNGKKGTHTFINRFEQSRMEEAGFGTFVDLSSPKSKKGNSMAERYGDL